MTNPMAPYDALREDSIVVSEWAGSDASRAIVKMLDSLGQTYCLELAEVSKDQLEALQAKLKQVYAIRNIVSGASNMVPKI